MSDTGQRVGVIYGDEKLGESNLFGTNPIQSNQMASVRAPLAAATISKESVDVEAESAGAATNLQFRLYPWRFAVVAGIFLISFSNTMNFSTYGAVTPTVAQHYNTDTTTITSLNMWNLIAFFPAIYPATWLLDTRGLRPALITAASINAFGCFLRWIGVVSSDAQTKIRLLYVGSALIGFSSPFTIDGTKEKIPKIFRLRQYKEANKKHINESIDEVRGALVLGQRTTFGERGDEPGVAAGRGGGALPVAGAGVGLGRRRRHAQPGVFCAGVRAGPRVARRVQLAADAAV
ncbi:Major facilitator super domain-containing protein 7 [Physocladia obscura]|uniref:Major facilitator super domain-containing protein 7 n=1 Tax=Physocladia obscura TaxID=109957 RepID=A0AAD5SPZ5_9FUNG|nr:Major facilitator super domain-containing protein 7 [Physocladia obscura]